MPVIVKPMTMLLVAWIELIIKPINKVFAWHRLNACRQNPGEALDFLQRLKYRSKDCYFVNSIAAQIYEAAIIDSSIFSIESNYFRA